MALLAAGVIVLSQPILLIIGGMVFAVILDGGTRLLGRVLPLGESLERLARGDLPARAVAITFDDGYADNRTIAMPILQALGLPHRVALACTGVVFLAGAKLLDSVKPKPAAVVMGPHPAAQRRRHG